MRKWFFAGLSITITVVISAPSYACIMHNPRDLNDVKSADVVLVGRIKNYEIILDKAARNARKKELESGRFIPPDLRKDLEEQKQFLSDYARFDIYVDEIIKGDVPDKLELIWQNSTSYEPEKLGSDTYLIALQRFGSPSSLSGSGAAAVGNPNEIYALLQRPCSGPFLLEPSKDNIATIRKILNGEVLVLYNDLPSSPGPKLPFVEKLIEHWKVVVAALAGFSLLLFAGFKVLRSRKRTTI